VPAPQFGVADRPRDIIDGSGRWLAEQFGWRWVKSRGQVEFRDGPQLLQLGPQSSRYSARSRPGRPMGIPRASGISLG